MSDSPSLDKSLDSLAYENDELRQAAELGTLLLKRNSELEEQLASLQDELVVSNAKVAVQANEISQYAHKCSELRQRLDALMRDTKETAENRQELKRVEDERDKLRRALTDAQTAIDVLTNERNDLSRTNHELTQQLAAVNIPLAVVSPTASVASRGSRRDGHECEGDTGHAQTQLQASNDDAKQLRRESTQLKRQLKDATSTVMSLQAVITEKDAEIEQLMAVIERQKQEANENVEVLASVRRASGPATPLKTVQRLNGTVDAPTFVISPSEDASWDRNDVPLDYAILDPAPLTMKDENVVDGHQDTLPNQPPLLHFPSLAAFNAAALAFGSPTHESNKKKPGNKESGARPPLAPSTSLLNVSGMWNSLSKITGPRKKREATEEIEAPVNKTSRMMRVLSDATLKPVNSIMRGFGKKV